MTCTSMPTARQIIEHLQLQPHPEGGWYRETWRGPSIGGRGTGTSIHYLLERGQQSHWHRIDASELWLHQGGGAMLLKTAVGQTVSEFRLGPDVLSGDLLQSVVEPGQWQAALPEADWALVTCFVAPAFEFSGFELAPPGWTPR